MMIINSLNDVDKFIDTISQEFNHIMTDLNIENKYHQNDLDDIYDFIKRDLEHDKKDMIDAIKKGKKLRIPEDDFMLELVNQFEESIQGQGIFRSLLLFKGNQILKDVILRIKQITYRYTS